MRHSRLIVIIAALLVGACGAQPTAQQTAQPTPAPATAASVAAPPTAATEVAFFSPSSAPAPSPTPAAAPTGTAEPTTRLILPLGTADPVTEDVPRMTLTPTTAPDTNTAPRSTAAQPAAARQPAAATAPSLPVRMEIKDIAFKGRVVSVGLDKDRIPIVPKHDVGWYNLSARPGQGDNIVLWGHVLRFRDSPKIPAPFARVKELKRGAEVVLYDKDGDRHKYVVTKQIWVTPDQVEYILPQGKEMVTMVSCIGDKIIQDGEVVDESHRLITIAEPAS